MLFPDVFIDSLLSGGVDYVFTVAAENIMPLLRALTFHGIHVINAKFEPSMGFMGLVYSRLSSRPGVIIATAGPGVFGAISPTAQAFIEGDPMVIIATVVRDGRGTQMHQLPSDDAQLMAFKPITKATFRINNPEEVGDVLMKAFSIALSGKPGPVYVEIPLDIVNSDVEHAAKQQYNIERPLASDEEVAEVADLLAEAEYPVILVGRGVRIANAEKLVIRLAELLNSPIVTTVMAKDVIPSNHRLYAGVAVGKAGSMVAHEVLSKADVILAVGNRFSEIGTGRYSLDIRGKLIHVNVDPYDLGRAYKPHISILSDAHYFLEKLLQELRKRNIRRREGIPGELRRLWSLENEDLDKYYTGLSGGIKPWEVIKAIRSVFVRKNTVFIGDVGAHRIESFLMPIYEGERYITTTSYVSMGLAVPGAVVSSIMYPDRDVVGLVGDGGFLMTGLEVSTAVQYGAKPKIVVFNDSAYRVLGVYEKVRFGGVTDELVRLPQVNFAMLAESLGAKGVVVHDRSELISALEEALNTDKACVVDVHIDQKAIPIPYQRLYGISTL